jgi:hypothetical protein
MSLNSEQLSCEVEVQPGQRIQLPASLVDKVGPGHWLVTVQPADTAVSGLVRIHSAFLASYSDADEGLYDDYPAG